MTVDVLADLGQIAALIGALALLYRPLGDWMAHTFTTDKDWRVERGVYKLLGVRSDTEQSWPAYARSVLAFSFVGVLLLYLLLRIQSHLPLSIGMANVSPALAFNTAASFVTNTNWQAYSGESTMGHLVQMSGLAVQNFVSAAVGLAVAVALVRGFTRRHTDHLGNFWVDVIRGTFRILIPLSIVSAVILIAAGAIDNFSSGHVATTLLGQHQTITGGPVASQEAIKELGNNGGGFYNANSAHPFESPNPFTNWLEIFLLLLIPVCLTRTFGTMVGNVKQGYAILAAMFVMWAIILIGVTWAEMAHSGAAGHLAGATMEGKETRFGVPGSSLFAVSTTGTSTGAIDAAHSSFTGVGGALLLFNMGLGEVAPGGIGAGLYSILVLAVMTVFVGGLMVGRTPEYLGKKIQGREIKLVSLHVLTMPLLVLGGTGLAITLKTAKSSILNPGPHGMSEILYAFMSASNNNGSAFAGLSANTNFYNIALSIAMLAGRFIPIVITLALAGSLAQQGQVPETSGTLRTQNGLFVGLLVGVSLIIAGLTFFPALALGPLAEGLK
ncbi:MAG: potassium-transporting ATPase subunit KdpA [Marmoricola sp.]